MTKVGGSSYNNKFLKSDLVLSASTISLAQSLFDTLKNTTGAVGKTEFNELLLKLKNNDDIINVITTLKSIDGKSLVYKISQHKKGVFNEYTLLNLKHFFNNMLFI